MLVYIRERDLPMVLDKLCPEAALQEPKRQVVEDLEQRQEEEPEASLHATVELVTEADVANFSHYTAAMDFAPLRDELTADDDGRQPGVLTVPVKKSEPIAAVMLHVRRELGIPLYRQRLWSIDTGHDRTRRVSQPLSHFRPSSAHPHRQGEAFLDSEAQDLMEDEQLRFYVEKLPELRGLATESSGDLHEPDWLDSDSTRTIDITADSKHAGGSEERREETLGETKRRRLRRLVEIVEAERAVQTCDDLLAFLKAFPPPPVARESIFLFFKRYDRTNLARPLEFLLARRVAKSQTVRSLLAKLRGWVPGLPEQDADVEVFVEATPKIVLRLSLNKTLEQSGLMNGDIVCIQRASAEVDAEEWAYTQAPLPHHVPAYFSYLVDRRTICFTPRTRFETDALRDCMAFIESRWRDQLVYDEADSPVDVMQDLSCQSTYRQVQEALSRYLRPALHDPHQLRFFPESGEVITDDVQGNKDLRLHDLLPPGHNPYKAELVFFEIQQLSSITMPVDDWLEGVEHSARVGKPKKKGKKGKKGNNKEPSTSLGCPPDPQRSAPEAAEPLDEYEWLEDKPDPTPARKARKKGKKGKKRRPGQGSEATAAEEAESKVEGRVASEGEQSDEDGGEEGAETEGLPLHVHGGGDSTVEPLERETVGPAAFSGPAGGDILAGEAEPPAFASGPAGGEQVMSWVDAGPLVRVVVIATLSVTVVGIAGGGGGGGGGGRARVR
jgi:hypothetical protein